MWWVRVSIIVAAFFVGSFGLWRGMREEHKQEEIINLALGLAGLGIIGWLLVGAWGILLGWILAMSWFVKRYEWSWWEWLDSVGESGMSVGLVLAGGWGSVKLAAVFAGGILVTWLVKTSYRRIRWYKSGRRGAVGLAAVVCFGLAQMMVAKSSGRVIYLGGWELAQWAGLWVMIAAVTTLYLRAGHRVTQDIGGIWRRK
ncbi:hypothetical protein A2899_00485 [Candidatus Amesbacteria bacterium RIFCSPLOWO2_01_FULL_49_25]|uniref:Uncharacterized protein n=1 Tax=Candidatus Amesbacteria bacterium RIFCSPHIGHO2_01_FULL_48_32b TaxID=1797253 RepID=A0A1F4YD53_9BACT|nr:MAG: hypothetical protein A2876_03925 [Candidatus Amesbacteria bacterium RIFCSPHIGHO2_01_FULL_48_32b]OGD07601.1 MAG: hypothetical protein A2899_00485 [Candidatus Amesbacteria bacterium RIFCSPLOWO2_01_FULL_49_25]